MRDKISLPRFAFSGAELEQAVEDARQFVRLAAYRDIFDGLSAQPGAYGQRVQALIEDLICGYPDVKYGIAVLMHVDAAETRYPIALPLPDCPPPDSDVTAVEWRDLRVLTNPYQPLVEQRGQVAVWPGQVTAAVLTLKTHGDEPPTIADEWLGELFMRMPGTVTVCVEGPMPWPAAMEAAAALLANATDGGPIVDTPYRFLGHGDYVDLQQAGRRYYDRLRTAAVINGRRMPR